MGELVTAVIGLIFGVGGGYLTARYQLALKYDADLRERRITEYRELWKRMEVLAKYARSASLSTVQLERLAADMRSWYFGGGGLFMSRETQQAYFRVQEALHAECERRSTDGAGLRVVDAQSFELLRVLSSRLRTSMTRDCGTRKTFKFRGELAAAPDRKVAGKYVERYPIDSAAPKTLEVSFRPGLRRLRWIRIPLVLTRRPRIAAADADPVNWRWDPLREAMTRDGCTLLVDDGDLVGGPAPVVWRRA